MLDLSASPTGLLEANPSLERFETVSELILNQESSPVPLKNLRAGQLGLVTRLVGSPYDVARLSEMGLRKGAEVIVIRNGITCILQLDGNRLCIRLSKDLTIWVVEAR